MNDRSAKLVVADRVYGFIVRRSAPIRFISGLGARVLLLVLARIKNFRTSTDRSLTDLHMLLGSYEVGTQQLCRRLLTPGGVVVDVGAHIGFFTRLFSGCVGDAGSVIAFEPHPETFRTLARNCEKRENVVLLQAAVAERSRQAVLFQSEQSSGSNSLIPTRALHHKEIPVPALALDDVLSDRVVDLVKIDVEGGELDVLAGMSRLIERSPRLIVIIELFPPVWESSGLAGDYPVQRLEELGFQVYVVGDSGRLRSVTPWDRDDFLGSIEKYVNLLAVKGSELPPDLIQA